MHENKSWLSAYLYYAEPWERLLVDVVKPFVEKAIREGFAENFFYIRYWEKGPHIRLRFKGTPEKLAVGLKPQLSACFEAHFQKNPSVRIDPEWARSGQDAWYHNNTLAFIDYVPEVARYGGPDTIAIAEQQFEYSSRAVLSILEQSAEWDYSSALGAALQLHLGFAVAAGMDDAEIAAFFEYLSRVWLPESYPLQVADARSDSKAQSVMHAFENAFKSQQDTIIPVLNELRDALSRQVHFEQEWYNKWLKDSFEISQALKQIQRNGRLLPPERVTVIPTDVISGVQQARWSIYESYIHMTNNRLGIFNRDEGYLGYLLMRWMRKPYSEVLGA